MLAKMRNFSKTGTLIKLVSLNSLTLLVSLLLVSESIAAIPSTRHIQIVQQPEVIDQDATRNKTQRLFEEGVQLWAQRRTKSWLQAIAKWEETLSLWQSLGDKSQEALTLLKIGEVYREIGTNKLALERYNQALKLYQETGDRLQEAISFSKIGDVYGNLGEQQKSLEFSSDFLNILLGDKEQVEEEKANRAKALKFYNQSLTIYQELGNRQEEATVLNNIGWIYFSLEERAKALDFFNQSLTIYQELGNLPQQASILRDIGVTYLYLKDQRKALDFYNQSLTLSERVNTTEGQQNSSLQQARTLNYLGRFYFALSPKKALEFYNHALTIYQKIGARSQEARTLINIGVLYINPLQDRKTAVEFYQRSLNIFQELGDISEELRILNYLDDAYSSLETAQVLELQNRKVNNLQILGQFYSDLGDTETAKELQQEEAATFIEIGNLHFYRLQDKEKALEFFNRSRNIYQAVGNLEEEADILIEIGWLYYYKFGDTQKALTSFTQARSVYQKVGNSEEEANILFKIGQRYYGLGGKDKAREFFNLSRRVYQELGDFEGEANILFNIGKFYSESGEGELALEFFNQSRLVYQKQGNREGEADVLIKISQIYFYSDQQKALDLLNQSLSISQELNTLAEGEINQAAKEREAETLSKIGEIHSLLKDYEKALAFYNKSLVIYQELSVIEETQSLLEQQVDVQLNINRIYYSQDKEKALEGYQQLLPIYQKLGDESLQAGVLFEIARLYSGLGNREKALEFYSQSLSIYNELDNFQQEAITLITVGKLYYQLEGKEKAAEFFNQSLKIYEERGNLFLQAGVLYDIAKLYTQLGDRSTALDYYNQSRQVYQELSDNNRTAIILVDLGQLYYQLGDRAKALESFNQYLSSARQVNERGREASNLNQIGKIYSDLGDKEQALEFYNQALKIFQELEGNEFFIVTVLNNIGKIHSDLGDHHKALELYNQAISLSLESINQENLFPLINIGTAYTKLGEQEKALEFYNQALTISQELGSLWDSPILIGIGWAYSQLGEQQKALEFYNQALSQRLNPSLDAPILSLIGKTHSKLGNPQKALEFYNQSLISSQEIINREVEAESLYGIAVAQKNLGNLDTALTQIEQCIAIIEDIRTSKASQEERQTYFESKQDYYKFYINLLMKLHQQDPTQGYDVQALQASERSRARILLELLTEANADIRQGIDSQLLQEELNLQQQLDAIEKQQLELYSNNSATNEQKIALAEEKKTLLKQYQELQTQIRINSPKYADLKYPQPLNLKQIQQQILDQDTVLLQYSLGKEHSYLWAVTKDNLTSYQLPPAAEIEDALRQFRDIILRPIYRRTPQRLATEANQLSNLLLKPVANQLDKKRLLIISDGALQYLPFSALSKPSINSPTTEYQPLISQYEIVNLPSVSTLAILRQELKQRQEIAPKQIAILADPIFSRTDERVTKKQTPSTDNQTDITWGEHSALRSAQISGINLDPLPATRQEAQGIMSLVPESQRIQVFDFAANRKFATSSQLSEYRIIHFATHGILNSEQPELSGVVLSLVDEQGNSQNGFLRLHDIFNLNLPGELVVLSACQTGLGKQVRGEGLIGLTRGFMYAGMPRILASLWSVDDEATAEFMTRFYRLMLKDKLSAAKALREAQIEMQEETKWKAPYYWAAFTLQGEWD